MERFGRGDEDSKYPPFTSSRPRGGGGIDLPVGSQCPVREAVVSSRICRGTRGGLTGAGGHGAGGHGAGAQRLHFWDGGTLGLGW